ncbi:MAG TPA: ABC transporter substrate-binding protein [Methylomirabilota bacterium]|nr:ABC transporter substrate-binding protein [Methylomirabilota bacterium]
MTPRDVVQSAVSRVVQTIEAAASRPEPARAGRSQTPAPRMEIRRLAAELFDFGEVGRRALGRHWTGRSPEEQTEFIALFTELLERAYVGKIEAYSGEQILYTNEVVDGDYAVVRSRVNTRRRAEIALDYRLHRTDGGWKVYDVLIDGVSFVSTYRSEFNRIIQLHSWDELMDRLRNKQIPARTATDRS